MDKEQLVIRKKTSLLSRLRRILLLVVLWVAATYIMVINVCFMLGVYSDALVVNYSLFNLSFHSYRLLGTLVVVIGLLVTLYSVVHLGRLKRKADLHDQNNA